MKKGTMVVSFLAMFALGGICFSLLAIAATTRLMPSGIQFPDGTIQTTAWRSSGNNIYYNGDNLGNGNVGIGENTPETRLHVSDSGSGNVVTIKKGLDGLVMQALGEFFSLIGWGDRAGGYNNLAIRASASNIGGIYLLTNGNVGIGTDDPQATLHVVGDHIGPFPKPAYQSPWTWVPPSHTITFVHNLGGDPDDYVVDMQCFDPPPASIGVNNQGIGGNTWIEGDETINTGAYWRELDSEMIRVFRGEEDNSCQEVRIRIWKY